METKVENEKTVATTTQETTTATLTNNESKKSIECEKKMDDEETKEVLASCIAELNSVENPQAQLVCVTEPVTKTESTEVAVVVDQKPATEEVKTDVEIQGSIDQQPSPATSETRLIAATSETTPAEVIEPVETKSSLEPTSTGKSASTVSLSSSAVNPVSPIPSSNDLNPTPTAEVVTDAVKLASKSASVSKSALNDETEPLNQPAAAATAE